MNKQLSVIIAWRNRDELRQTLMHNTRAFQACASEALVINAGGDSRRLKELLDGVDFEVRQIDIPYSTFNKSLCLNLGAFCSSPDSDLIFFLDADILLEQSALSDCLDSQVENSFVVLSQVEEFSLRTKPNNEGPYLSKSIQTTEIICADGRTARINNQTWFYGARTGMGLILVPKRAFVEINGANADLTGWGFEDTDIQIRLQLALGMQSVLAGKAVHLTHSDKVRDLGGAVPEAGYGFGKNIALWKNEALAYRNYMQGNFLGTYRRDVTKWEKTLVET